VITTPGTPSSGSAKAVNSPAPEAPSTHATRTAYTGWRSAIPHTEQPEAHKATPVSTVPQTHKSKPTPSPKNVGQDAGGIAYHKVFRQTQLAFSETADQTEYGFWYYLAENTASMTYQSGIDVDVRSAFVTNGSLPNTQDSNFRAINDQYPVFGFAYDLGTVGADSQTALFGISLNQQDAVQFEGADGVQPQPSLWTSYFDTDQDAISWFYNDYSNVSQTCTDFDNQVTSDSSAAAGDNYALITTLAARQAFGALQLTGTPDSMYMFLKEISSDGNVNTVRLSTPASNILLTCLA
jgi:hypothetical protein